MNWLRDIKIVIFDLDGTLYQDYRFLKRYLGHMFSPLKTEHDMQEIISEAYSILEGNHPVRFGYYYNHENLKPSSSFFWDGQEHDGVEESGENLFYIGDPWCIASVYADRHNISEEKRMCAFELVRKEMLCEPHQINPYKPLFNEIADLTVDYKILMTNTPGASGPEFVKYLEIEHLFDEYYYDARKPEGIKSILERLFKEGYHPQEILSVGDNPFNDLYPVKQAGGKTCLISQYEHADITIWDESVKSIEELTGFLRKFKTMHV